MRRILYFTVAVFLLSSGIAVAQDSTPRLTPGQDNARERQGAHDRRNDTSDRQTTRNRREDAQDTQRDGGRDRARNSRDTREGVRGNRSNRQNSRTSQSGRNQQGTVRNR